MVNDSKIEPIEQCAKMLKKHGFDVEVVANISEAQKVLIAEIEATAPKIVSYGDSLTLRATGIIEQLKQNNGIIFYDGFDLTLTRAERMEVRRKALMSDLFFTGVNAVSITGSLFWRDMIGNRIAPVAFGPKRVVLLVGKNKIVDGFSAAMQRIKDIAGPQNIARHPGFKTPCLTSGKCSDCNSPDRICNASLILDRCYPKGRILVVLIDENLGL